MNNRPIKYYRLTEWSLIKRWLLIGAIFITVFSVLWLVINLKVAFCPGKIDCTTAPKHSLRNLL